MNPIKTLRDWQRRNVFGEMVYQGNLADMSDKTAPRLVVLVRDDVLPPIHQGIQAAHAIVQLVSCGIKVDPRSYIILLGASAKEIDEYSGERWKQHRLASSTYADPGLIEGTRILQTACAFEPISNAQVKKYFGHLRRAE